MKTYQEVCLRLRNLSSASHVNSCIGPDCALKFFTEKLAAMTHSLIYIRRSVNFTALAILAGSFDGL
jgi:hypothetical protein